MKKELKGEIEAMNILTNAYCVEQALIEVRKYKKKDICTCIKIRGRLKRKKGDEIWYIYKKRNNQEEHGMEKMVEKQYKNK